MAGCVLLVTPFALGNQNETLPDPLSVQRGAYQKAVFDLNTGRIRDFQHAKKQLLDYPLYPYLEYYDLLRNVNRLKFKRIAQFRNQWPDSPLSDRLYRTWMLAIARRGEWKQYLKHYEPTRDTESRCYYLRALYRTGEKETALAGVQNLWLTPKSQPKACDPLFATWIEKERLTSGVAWQRLILALDARQRKLARFLLRYFEGTWKSYADNLYRVHRQPQLLARFGNFRSDKNLTRDTIRIGLLRWAEKDPEAAMSAWQHYRDSHSFTALEQSFIQQALEIQLARHDLTGSIKKVSPSPDGRHLLLLEALAQSAIRTGNWFQVEHWITQMPVYERIRPRWRYWRGRAAQQRLKLGQAVPEPALSDLRKLARQRNYYGFLAAERLGLQPRLNHATHTRISEDMNEVRRIPGILRALELFSLDDITNARREWLRASQALTLKQRAAAAHLAATVGWIDQSIRTANGADLYDALELRFPIAWVQIYQKESYASGLPKSLLYAITRQESAFEANARSSAGARGLMQLLPSTASLTARRLGVKAPARGELNQPRVNVKLGSRYLASLLARYSGVLPYAIAAYNAGPNRVDRWVEALTVSDLDAWIEAIPFYETRNYVKNVLAFNRVYAQRLEQQQPKPKAGYPLQVGPDSASPAQGQMANPDLQSFPLL